MSSPTTLIAIAGIIVALLLALGSVLRKRRSVASWCFCVGMLALAVEGLLCLPVLSGESDPEATAIWIRRSYLAKAFIPGFWLVFSLTYSRGNADEFLRRWSMVLTAAFLIPLAVAGGLYGSLIRAVTIPLDEPLTVLFLGSAGKALNGVLLLASVVVLINLEKTIRAAVGTERWRVKFVFLGVGVIFGTRIYTSSQALLFSAFNPGLLSVESGALLIGCVLVAVAYLRHGFREVEIYPSRTFLQGSLTLVLAGGYLTVVGVLAQLVSHFRWGNFQGQAFVILIGISVLAVLLLSDRVRTATQRWIARHFKRPEHDFRKVWTSFTQRTYDILDAPGLCRASAELISETFNVLNVVAFVRSEDGGQLVRVASTAKTGREEGGKEIILLGDGELVELLQTRHRPFDLDRESGAWAQAFKEILPSQFSHGGHRMLVPLATGDRLMGVLILADRVNGVPYSFEERELLGCIADQLAAALLNRVLSEEIMQAKELEAFQTMSTFFVHDLKNAANSLTLMLENLPRHFDDPEFRADALRMIGKTINRINGMIQRLSSLRRRLEIRPEKAELNALVEAVLGRIGDSEVERNLRPLPLVHLDRKQIESVVTNLVINAREAAGPEGRVQVATEANGGEVLLMVEDDGCGMAQDYIKSSLFRPFSTTKSKGLGIGLFQCKMIVEAHHGSIQVESEPGVGTKFTVSIPLERDV